MPEKSVAKTAILVMIINRKENVVIKGNPDRQDLSDYREKTTVGIDGTSQAGAVGAYYKGR